MSTKKCHKNATEYYCKLCDFTCSKESNYKIHLRTRKHQLATNSTCFMPKNATYFCGCGKKYKDRTGLWRHKKKCTYSPQETPHDNYSEIEDKDKLIRILIDKLSESRNNFNNSLNNNFMSIFFLFRHRNLPIFHHLLHFGSFWRVLYKQITRPFKWMGTMWHVCMIFDSRRNVQN